MSALAGGEVASLVPTTPPDQGSPLTERRRQLHLRRERREYRRGRGERRPGLGGRATEGAHPPQGPVAEGRATPTAAEVSAQQPRGEHLVNLEGEPLTFEQASERVLATLQSQMPLGLWAITQRQGERQLFLATSHQHPGVHDEAGSIGDAGASAAGSAVGGAGGRGYELSTGAVVDWEGSMCQAMVAGAPRATHDAGAERAYALTAPVRQWPVRTYLAAPIATPDGALFGTLCGYGAAVGDLEQVQQMGPVVQLLADMLGQVLLSEHLRARAEDREAHLYRLATRDHLTGLANRAVFHDRLAHALDLHRTSGRALSVLLIDVDDFKAVNDTHGHGGGDALLAHLAEKWGAQVQAGNTLARIGGDEFALLIETGLSEQQVLDAVHRGFASPMLVPGTQMRVTTSVGLAHLRVGDASSTAAELLSRADRALYASKASGKAAVTVAQPWDSRGPRPGIHQQQ